MVEGVLVGIDVGTSKVCALIGEVSDMDQAGAERVVERQAESFERTKPYLLERWGA